MASVNRGLALGLFAVLALAAPLLFGAVDRVVQAALAFGIGLGFLLMPPTMPQLQRWVKWCIALGIGFVVLKDFLPFAWFGDTAWHQSFTRDFGIMFPRTHNPEPGRAFDTVLTAALAGAWFVWARTLAQNRGERLALAWCLFGAAAVFAVVCLAFGTRGDSMIYGVRYTPGWTGFGAFPNRNHTATLLAMGVLIGCGCTIHAARRKHWPLLITGLLAMAVIFVAMLESKSRGGLMGFGCGLVVFGVLTLLRFRSRAALAGALAAVFSSAGLLLAFGAKTLARFNSPVDGNLPTNLRWEIWRDTVTMWKDAPLFGHGLNTFAQLFPFYQTVKLDEQIVRHPESSWLQWLVEMGAVPVLVAAIALAVFLFKNVRETLETERGFFVRACGLAALATLLCHSLFDVPSHRWATAGFGLALLAIACPMRSRVPQLALTRSAAVAPLAIAAFWLMPWFAEGPVSSPEALRRLTAKSASAPSLVPKAKLESALKVFPLSPYLHHALGARHLATGDDPAKAWREFRIADKLSPFSWTLPVIQASISRPHSPGMALHFWSIAIERGGRRTEELFFAAYANTRELPGAKSFWKNYVLDRKELLLTFSECFATPDESRVTYDHWWRTRGLTANDLTAFEIQKFYVCAKRLGTPEQLDAWMKHRPELEARDFSRWAALLHRWQRDDAAWRLLSRWVKEPQFASGGRASSAQPPEMLEARWRANPEDPINAQVLAEDHARRGNTEQSRQVILTVAGSKNAPPWFLQKAAYLHAANSDFGIAVETLLRCDL